MAEYLININCVNEVLPAAYTKADRPHIQGVHIEDEDGFRIYTATDGHVLFSVKEERNGDPLEKPITINISRSIKNKAVYATLILVDKDTAVIKAPEDKLACDIVDYEFPNWRNCVPYDAEIARCYAFFQPDLIKKAMKFCKAVGEKKPQQADGYSSALWESEEETASGTIFKECVVMPVRVK